MDEALKQRALADIDRVLAYQPSYSGTGAVTEIAISYKACILRWAPPGSTHRKMAEELDPFPTTRAARLEQHARALMASFRRDVEAGQVDLVGEPQEAVTATVRDELHDLNAMARRLLAYLYGWAIKASGRPFSINPHDPDTLNKTGLDGERYMSAGGWLVRKSMAKWFASGGMLTITDYGIQVAGNEALLDDELPIADGGVERRTDTGDRSMATTSPRIFISHAGGDAKLAKALIDLIEAGLEVPTGAIRCTSVDGYKLDGGDDAPQVLRENLGGCAVVLGVLTRTSVSSSYVLMELGAAWAFEKKAIPLIGLGATFGDLPGPFKDIHALRMEHEPDMSGLIATLAKETGFAETRNLPKITAALKQLTQTISTSGAPGVSPPATFRSSP